MTWACQCSKCVYTGKSWVAGVASCKPAVCNLRFSVRRQILCLQRSGPQKWVSSPQSFRREKIEPLRSVCALCPSDFRGAFVLKGHRFRSSMSACVGTLPNISICALTACFHQKWNFGKDSPAVYSVQYTSMRCRWPSPSFPFRGSHCLTCRHRSCAHTCVQR